MVSRYCVNEETGEVRSPPTSCGRRRAGTLARSLLPRARAEAPAAAEPRADSHLHCPPQRLPGPACASLPWALRLRAVTGSLGEWRARRSPADPRLHLCREDRVRGKARPGPEGPAAACPSQERPPHTLSECVLTFGLLCRDELRASLPCWWSPLPPGGADN